MKQKRITWVQCIILLAALVFGTGLIASDAGATNGDNLIAVGPIARAMGGVGIAAPQDAISAVFSNPAAMCFGPYCPGSEFDFATTIFMPKARTRINNTAINAFSGGALDGDTGWKDSDSDLFFIPALGISAPITQNLRFGFAAYGVSGLGVDYRDKFDLDPFVAPHKQDVYTNLSILKIAPNLAYMVSPNFSIGAAIHIDYGSLDLGEETESGFGIGGQLGAIYKAGPVSLGLVYVSPQKVKHGDVADFDGDGDNDDLKLESPQSLGFGVAYEPITNVFLIETDVKWLNWSDADGYDDFGWEDQWVFNIGAQYKPTPKLALRVGYNYGKNPVEEHNGWEGAPPANTVNVQGKDVNRFQYEVLRITGFPAVVEHHLTAGIGYQISKNVSLNLGYMHAFKNEVKEKGTFAGFDATIESTLSEDSIDLGLTYRF